MQIKLSDTEILEIKRLLEPKIEMNFKRSQSVISPQGDPEAAMKKLYEFAIAKGAPELSKGQSYGLGEDGIVVGLDRKPLDIDV